MQGHLWCDIESVREKNGSVFVAIDINMNNGQELALKTQKNPPDTAGAASLYIHAATSDNTRLAYHSDNGLFPGP